MPAKVTLEDSLALLADDARTLLATTARTAENTVMQARDRFSDTLHQAADAYYNLRKASAKAATSRRTPARKKARHSPKS